MNSSRVLINNPRYFTATSISIIILYFLKAFMMYQVLQIFLKIDLNNPFSRKLYEIISRLSGLALTIGLTNIMLKRFALWMTKRGETHNLFSFLDSADEFIFFAGILFVLSLVHLSFKVINNICLLYFYLPFNILRLLIDGENGKSFSSNTHFYALFQKKIV